MGYKVNGKKSLALLYTNTEKSEREIKESIPFTIATKRIKYLGINLPKEKRCKKPKLLSGEALQIAVKGREAKSKGEKEDISI